MNYKLVISFIDEKINNYLAGSIIPGNINSDHQAEKFIFHQKLALEELVSEAKNWRKLPMNDIIMTGGN